MYNNYTLHYLNHMGIIPWVTRNNKQTSTNQPIVVLTSTELRDKTRTLFDYMMRYINLNQDNIMIITVPDLQLGAHWNEPLLNKMPLALISFGIPINNLDLPYPIFECAPIQSQLKSPILKKEMLQVLTRLKTMVASGPRS